MIMPKYLTPINAGGIQRFTEGATAPGWYQLDLPGALNPALPGVTVPPNATGMLVQSNASFDYCLSPEDAALGLGQALTMPTGDTMFLTGRNSVLAFCVQLIGAGANITFQFYTGDLGPVPSID
jgi:hypothetical protein